MKKKLKDRMKRKLRNRTPSRLVVVSYADSDGKPGRVYEKWDVYVKESIQDDGRTLKLFVRDRAKKQGPC